MLSFESGDNDLEIEIPVGELSEGKYLVSLDIAVPCVRYIQRLEDCLSFELTRSTETFGTRAPNQAWGFGSMYFRAKLAEPRRNYEINMHAAI